MKSLIIDPKIQIFLNLYTAKTWIKNQHRLKSALFITFDRIDSIPVMHYVDLHDIYSYKSFLYEALYFITLYILS